MKPIAYQVEEAGDWIHVGCWNEFEIGYRARTGCTPFLGTLMLPGHPESTKAICPVCKQFIRCPRCHGKRVVPGFRVSDYWKLCDCKPGYKDTV